MANRKARSVVITLPVTATIQSLKEAIYKEQSTAKLTVLQDLGNGSFLAEFEEKDHAEDIIDSGIDWNEIHITCHPPHGYYINVSLLGLTAYIEDDDILEVLRQFGEIKSEVIRLKYKSEHEFAGLENGNRLVKMVLSKPAIPYSLRIAGEWCRVIHNNQQRVCSNCFAVDHSRRNCPDITCNHCHEKGHLSFNCPTRFNAQENNPEENTTETSRPNENENPPEHTETAADSPSEPSTEAMPTDLEETDTADPGNTPIDTPTEDTSMDDPENSQLAGLKRAHASDSDQNLRQRRNKIRPQPNLATTRPKRSNAKDPKPINFLQSK